MSVRVGDNIYLIGAQVRMTLRAAGWTREAVESVLREISATPTYDEAVAVCRRYITIGDEDED